jgi:hypothetical protein
VADTNVAITRSLAELSGEELATKSAQELIEALGGLGQMMVTKDGFYTTEFAEMVKQQPVFPLMIATPDNWRAPFPYSITMQVNGMNVTIEADKLTLVPQVFYENWMNHVSGEAALRQARRNAGARLSYSHINQVPFYQG